MLSSYKKMGSNSGHIIRTSAVFSLQFARLDFYVTRTFPNLFLFALAIFFFFSFFPPGATQPIVGVYFTALYGALAYSHTRLLDHTQRRATVGRTSLDE
jgi:hypothetical protein